jgi:hypothetical protein
VADAEQAMAVGPGAGAAGARLDAEQVVQQRGDELRVQVAPAGLFRLKETMPMRRAGSGLPRISMPGCLAPAVEGAPQQFALAPLDAPRRRWRP